MERLVLAVVLGGVAAVVALLLTRRTQPSSGTTTAGIPAQLHRADFPRPDASLLVALFSSATCDSCKSVWARARLLESPEVAVVDVEVGAAPELHRRYAVDAVPMTLVADREGRVVHGFLGPVLGDDLAAAVARAAAETATGSAPGELPPS